MDLLDEYKENKPEPGEDAPVKEIAEYCIQFVKDKISDISELINSGANDITPINIILKDNPDNLNQKNSTLILNKVDIPLALLYMNALNKPLNAVCSEDGTIELSEWTIKETSNVFKKIFKSDYAASRYTPPIKNMAIKLNRISTENGKCIGVQLTNTPASGIEVFVYTSNSDYNEVLSKIDFVTTLTSSDLDVSTKLKNKYTKNIVIIVLNDLPTGKSINLNGIRRDAKVFFAGLKENQVENIYKVVQEFYDLYDQYDYDGESDGSFDHDKNDEMVEERERKQNELISKLLSQYTNYQIKAFVTFSTIQTLAIISINYYGNHIRCTNFYPIASTFSNFKSMSNDFSAQVTITDSITYKLIADLPINDLVLFPVSFDPYNVFGIEQIDFTENQWKLKGYYNEPGLEIANVEYTIDTSKIRGSLHLISTPTKCIFNVPDNKANQVLKGLSVDFDFYSTGKFSEIPVVLTSIEIGIKLRK